MPRQLRSLLFLASVSAAGLGGFAVAKGAPEALGSKQDAGESARRSGVLASSKEAAITVGEVEDVIRGRPPWIRAKLTPRAAQAQLVEELVRYDLLAHEAQRRGYAEHALVIEAAKRAAIDRMTARSFTVPPTAISDDDVAREYAAEQPKLSRPSWRRASVIELASEPEARALIAELSGTDRMRFAAAARLRSRDPKTARQSGELGYFDSEGKRDKGEPAGIAASVVAATFALDKVGDITRDPIAHDGTFGVVMLTGEMAAFQKPLAKVAPGIRERLAAERSTQALDAKLAALRVEYKPEVHPELVDAIALDPPRPSDRPEGFPVAPRDPRAALQATKPDEY